MKIVINACYGGFGLSHKAMMRYFEIKGQTVYPEKVKPFFDSLIFNKEKNDDDDIFFSYWMYWTLPQEKRKDSLGIKNPTAEHIDYYNIERNDSALVQTVEELGSEGASSLLSKLKIVEIPDDVGWTIEEYDGSEWVAEKHRTWS